MLLLRFIDLCLQEHRLSLASSHSSRGALVCSLSYADTRLYQDNYAHHTHPFDPSQYVTVSPF